MKRLFLLVSCFCMLLLVSCGVAEVSISFSKDVTEVESVEIYNLAKTYTNADVHNLRDENTPMYILDDEQVEGLLTEISSLDFTEERIYFPAPVDWIYVYEGYVVSVVYTDGSYDIIDAKGQLYFENRGDGRYRYGHADYCGEESWDDIIESYIQE